jgi:hypothetical protein
MAPWTGARWCATAATALICAVAAVGPAPANAQDAPRPCSLTLALAPFLRERPPACWRPYDASSPWNHELEIAPPLDERSETLAAALGDPRHVVVNWADESNDYARPTYYSQPGDPVFTPVCTADLYGACPVEGLQVAIPDDARPAGGGDGHLTVIDPLSGWEYDFWQVTSKPVGGGELYASWGGHARIDGDGLGGDRVGAVAWGGPTQAGLVRPEELEAGAINHAILMIVACDNGTFVYPARHSGRKCLPGQLATAPAMGQRFRLALSDEQIAALDVPAWKKTLLRAMAHYGLIVGDTGGDEGWGIQWESGVQYTSLGRPDEWVTLAQRSGIPQEAAGDYVFSLRDGVDWAHDLEAVAPCVSLRTC